MSVPSPRTAAECRYDLVALGEVMLRLDPGEDRIRNARAFRVWEGGGEYNVARGLFTCFGQRTAIVTALADNEVGRLVENLVRAGGVDTSLIGWTPYDGMGSAVRNGLNFTERGYGVRGARGVPDRARTAAGQLKPDDVDWDDLFGRQGVRWFHTGGVYAALSDTTPDVIETAMRSARAHGTIVSYDLNHRPSLWSVRGGENAALAVHRRLTPLVDVMIGCLGASPSAADPRAQAVAPLRRAIEATVERYRSLRVVATTLRTVRSATVNDWGALAWADGTFAEAAHRPGLEILDRVGGGDGFVSGLAYGLLSGHDLRTSVEYGAAHGALAMTTPGDVSVVDVSEVESLMAGDGAAILR